MSSSKINVPSGSYSITKKKDALLEAYLGTCVGVTLFDREAEVGGLLHLLLPEPTSSDNIWQPENYATTGLPRFITAMCNAGARKENLIASVAGGALVGPLSEIDLNLDIGGRTAEAVEEILKHNNIPIEKIETGGYFTCRISLKLQTFESRIKPIDITPALNSQTMVKKPSPGRLEKIIEKVRPIPQIALKVIRMIRDDKHSMQDLAREVRRDQVISAKVIRLSNSAFFGKNMSVDSIDRALVLMGEKRFMQLIISASMEEFFPENGLGYSLCKGGVYKHALGTAMISESLALLSRKVQPDIAYTAGLLHDIGKVVLDQYIASALPLFYRRTQVEGANLITVENEEFGTTHTEVGGRLAERWSLPESLADTIQNHHNPEQASVSPELTYLVYIADLLTSRFLVGQELERLNTKKLASRLEGAGLDPKNFPAIVDSIPRDIFSATLAST